MAKQTVLLKQHWAVQTQVLIRKCGDEGKIVMSKIPATQKQEDKAHAIKAKKREEATRPAVHVLEHPTLSALQNHLGNAAIQRLLAQRSGGDGAFDLDEATAGRINAARSGGQALDGPVQTQMSQSMGADFSGVRVHTGSEAHQLNEQLSAKAFTTGSDIFFREGEYAPHSSGGQELIAHELTHVVQQGSGAVGGSGGAMRVNAPGDRFEQEADSVAKTVSSAGGAPAVQRQAPEEEEVQTKRLQRQEEEEPVQAKRLQRQEEEEPVQAKRLQRQEMPEEEVQTQRLQRQEEEEPVQKQEMPEEEEAVQKQAMPEEEPAPA